VDRAVGERAGQRVVDEPVLLDAREPVEARARDDDLEMVAAARPVLDGELARVREGALEQTPEVVDGHRAHASPAYALRVDELGLFPLPLVLLPTEQIPLHIFEERYQELIEECLEGGEEFGVVLAEDDGVREVGTRAAIVEVLERFDDGRLNIAIEGRERFRVVELTEGRSFHTALVEPLQDETPGPAGAAEAKKALVRYRRLARVADAEIEEPDPASPVFSYEIAARVDFGTQRKQTLLELRSEPERLELVSRLLVDAARIVARERELREAGARNGKPRNR
jgi:Lon protease-like protein